MEVFVLCELNIRDTATTCNKFIARAKSKEISVSQLFSLVYILKVRQSLIESRYENIPANGFCVTADRRKS